jgi:hypothetical protein
MMIRKIPICVWSLAAVLGLAVLEVGGVSADPSPDCRNLAAWFATKPAQLSTKLLSALGDCVMQEIQTRAESQEPTHPPETQEGSPASQGPSLDSPGWGPWDPPAPWKDDAAKTTPWDAWDK